MAFSKRVLFRFALLYFVLYTYPFPINKIPSVPRLEAALEDVDWNPLGVDWNLGEDTKPFYEALQAHDDQVRYARYAVADWTARHAFGIERELDRPFGSGDPTHSYIMLVATTVLAAGGCVVWSLFDRWRARYVNGGPWLHLAARYWLAFFMFTYGFIKVFPMQFRFPGLARLVAPYGDGTPMNLLWSFMGSSEPYIIFSGAAEVLAGLLLVFRRTATLGALAAFVVMTNVAAMNYCYDVPVKLFSSHLLLVALLLLLPDLRRLAAVFFLNRPAPPRDLLSPRFPRGLGHVARLVFVGSALFLHVKSGVDYVENAGKRHEMYGIWDVTSYAIAGEEVPPLMDHPVRWQNLLVETAGFGSVRAMDGTRSRCNLAFDDAGGTLTLRATSTWTYSLESDGTLLFEGEFTRWFRKDPRDFSQPMTPRDPQVVVRMVRRGAAAEGLEGTWDVTSVEAGELRSSLRSAPGEWKSLVVDGGEARVTFPNGHTDSFRFHSDTKNGRVTFTSSSPLSLTRSSADEIRLSGVFRGHEIDVQLKRRSLDSFLLVRRGFNWINETPLNRF